MVEGRGDSGRAGEEGRETKEQAREGSPEASKAKDLRVEERR